MTNSSASSNTGVAELFHMLESNKLSEVEDTKKVFHDHFLSTKDNWLVNGLFDYYLSTDSLRAVEVLAGVREPHDKHLFDKLSETLAAKPTNNGQKVQTLTLLGHVARRQPTWLYKLASHTLFKQLVYLLKIEEDIVLLMSALLLLITLLPMLPTALTPHLHEVFEVFSRLASFHYHRFLSISSTNSVAFAAPSFHSLGNSDADQLYLLHLQVGLQNLFHRLYAMYPCNFVSFLKQQYQRDQIPIFKKIISPMLDSVRMHPLLVTMSKDSEISSARWKKMEHHDVVAECGRFSLSERPNRDETVSFASMRFTPISDYSCPYTPINCNSELTMVVEKTNNIQNGNQETFWSPSMVVPAQSPPPPSSFQATPILQYETKSAPSTPGGAMGTAGNNSTSGSGTISNRSRTSPPEAAVEATPETTPVKDLRQIPGRQVPVGSAAVRALSALGNGAGSFLISSRPSTPTSANHHHHHIGSSFLSLSSSGTLLSSCEGTSILDRKLGKIVADRQNAMRQEQQQHAKSEEESKRTTASTAEVTAEHAKTVLNGRADSWQPHQMQLEDQEVSDIVSARKSLKYTKDCNEKDRHAFNDLSRKVRLKHYCKYPTPPPLFSQSRRKSKSCPEIASVANSSRPRHMGSIGLGGTFRPVKTPSTTMEDSSTQTCGLLPYEYYLVDVLEQRGRPTPTPTVNNSNGTTSEANATMRLSPSAMLERYIEVCARTGSYSDGRPRSKPTHHHQQQQQRRQRADDDNEGSASPQQQQLLRADGEDGTNEVTGTGGCWGEMDRANQQIQLMLMQLQFERQRREVHSERNRRLLGKLRDLRALEELNSTMTNRLKLAENEIEALKSELSLSKMEARTGENKLVETIYHWQAKCKEEQQRNATLKDRIEILEDELKSEKKKVIENEKQTRAAKATLFEAAHQLKEVLKTANQCDELKRVLDSVQKRFLLLGEAQTRIQEKMGYPVHMVRQESVQMQRTWSEEVSNVRRQLDSQTLQVEAMKSRLGELEHKDARKEIQLVDQQRLLQESKEKHSAELEAVESKYKAQLEINLLLEARILELHGKLEQAITANCGTSTSAMMNLASSASPKERSPPLSASLASSSEGSLAFIHSVMNDCCDPGGEIANLQAIVEPAVITTAATIKSGLSQQR